MSRGGEGTYLDVHKGENSREFTVFLIACQIYHILLVSKEDSSVIM